MKRKFYLILLQAPAITGRFALLRRFMKTVMNRLVLRLKGQVSKEIVVLRRWESIAGNLVLTTELKRQSL